jgi:hypothetical protein
MNEDQTDWKEQLREAARIAMLNREAEIRRRTLASLGQCTCCSGTHPLSRCPAASALIRQKDVNDL